MKRADRILNGLSLIAVAVILAGVIWTSYAFRFVLNVEPAGEGVQDNTDDVVGPPSSNGGQQAKPQSFTVSTLCDNDDFVAFTNLLDAEVYKNAAKRTGFFPNERFAVTLLQEDGHPAAGRRVELVDKSGRVCFTGTSDKNGVVYLFSSPFSQEKKNQPNLVRVENKKGKWKYSFPVFEKCFSYTFTLSDKKEEKQAMDIMVLCDTTASMEDEFFYLKNEFSALLQGMEKAYVGQELRFSICFFRDEGDSYVVKTNPFTDDLHETLLLFEEATTSGGGNYSESVHTALSRCLNRLDWNEEADTKLLFLLTDASNHDDAEVRTALKKSIQTAAERGVRIIGIGGNDTDAQAEYMLRAAAVLTGGSYVSLQGNPRDESGENKLYESLSQIIEKHIGLKDA